MGAIVTLADDGENGGILTTQQNNAGSGSGSGNGNGGGTTDPMTTPMTGGGTGGGMTGGGTGGGMTGGGGATLPTTMISSNDNNDGTITWTVTFGAGIDISAVDEMQFATSDNAMLSMFSRSGNMVTFVSTHTADGSITLDYTGTLAAMQTSTAVALTIPPPPMPMPDVNYLEDITSDSGSPARTSDSRDGGVRQVHRSALGTTTTVTLGPSGSATNYVFTSTASTNAGVSNTGQLISDNNELLIVKQEVSDTAGILGFFTGTNVGDENMRSFNTFDLTSYSDLGLATSRPSGASVEYQGDYIYATVPSGTQSVQENILRGEFDLTINFTSGATALVSGSTNDGAAMPTNTGQFTSLVLRPDGTGVLLMGFTGAGDLDGVSLTFAGDFHGSNGAEIHATAKTTASARTPAVANTRAVMAIVGERQP